MNLFFPELLSGANNYYRTEEVVHEDAATLSTMSQGRAHDYGILTLDSLQNFNLMINQGVFVQHAETLVFISMPAPDDEHHGEEYALEDYANPIGMVHELRGRLLQNYSSYPRLSNKLYAAFEAVPLEDGIAHAADVVISDVLETDKRHHALEWLKGFCLDATRPEFASSVLRCLGRQNRPGTPAWRTALVEEALTVDNVQIRDAAVQSAESWADQTLRNILESHDEPVSWLRDYIRDVMDDVTWN